MGLTEADEINKNEKTSTHINMYDSHDVDKANSRNTLYNSENMQNNAITYVCTYVCICIYV